MCWPANQTPRGQAAPPESPHEAAIANRAEPVAEAKPRRRRSTKPAE